jgi:hypothetical protein
MRSNLLIYGIYASLVLPIVLLSVAWRRNKREKGTFVLLLVSGILLFSATVRYQIDGNRDWGGQWQPSVGVKKEIPEKL